MIKKLFSILLICILAIGTCACNVNGIIDEDFLDTMELDFSKGGQIKVWVPEEIASQTNNQCERFFKEYPEYHAYSFSIETVGEDDSVNTMLSDVENGADIYSFPQDQLARLVSTDAIMASDEKFVTLCNDAGAVKASMIGDTTYGYPITSDNGFFLYYDSSVVSDPSTIEGILDDCEAAGKNFYMELNSGWYQTAFFFGSGCKLSYDIDTNGAFTACNVNYASENGVKAFRAMLKLAESKAFKNGSSIADGVNIGAIVDGTWDSSNAKRLFGENYACAKLPTFGGVQMSGFSGFKLLGVKPQDDPAKEYVANELAKYLSDEKAQIERFNLAGWGPSNIKAAQDANVCADEALNALREQIPYMIPQGQYPVDYWMLSEALGDEVISHKYSSAAGSDQIMAVLQEFQDTCISYAQ